MNEVILVSVKVAGLIVVAGLLAYFAMELWWRTWVMFRNMLIDVRTVWVFVRFQNRFREWLSEQDEHIKSQADRDDPRRYGWIGNFLRFRGDT